MRDQFIQTLGELAARDPRIVLITGDLGFAVFDKYKERLPSQFINAGVAEQNMTLVATGMALEGRIVFTYSIGNFPTLRCLEMIRNDAAYHGANVKVVSIGGGFSYGALGISHHATEDLAILRAIPDVTCFAPTSIGEVAECTHAAATIAGTCFLRLDKDKGFLGKETEPFDLGRPRKVRSGAHIAFFVAGGIISEVSKAADLLEKSNIGASIYAVHTIKPIKAEAFAEAARTHDAIVTVEEHTVQGGLGSLVLETLADAGAFPRRFLRIGLDDCFSSIVGSQGYLRSVYKMDAINIARRSLALLST